LPEFGCIVEVFRAAGFQGAAAPCVANSLFGKCNLTVVSSALTIACPSYDFHENDIDQCYYFRQRSFTVTRTKTAMLDALIVSDIHLGSSNCQAKLLCELLEQIKEGRLATHELILNGDVFDSIDFRRLTKSHWKVLSLLRKLSDRIDITWICGNHDGSAEIVSHLLGVTVKDEYVLQSGGRKILVLHGHAFDDFVDSHPILTWIGDCIYFFLQWLDKTHHVARLAKKGSKTFVRCAKNVEQGSIAYARKKHCAVVCCGHTHYADISSHDSVPYYNSGCWTELPCTYLAIADGHLELLRFPDESFEARAERTGCANLRPKMVERRVSRDTAYAPGF
jgi:UDP-2,3-diacylglucosamine pyrophosphatase LpxH